MSDIIPPPAVVARLLAEASFPPSEPPDYLKARAFEEVLIGLVSMAADEDPRPLHVAVREAARGLLVIAANAMKAPDNQPPKGTQ